MAVLSSGRPSQRAFETVFSRVFGRATCFLSNRPTLGVCSPARAEWMTGLTNQNNLTSGTNGGTIGDLNAYYWSGTKAPIGWVGPHWLTIAPSLPDVPLDYTAMVAAGVMRDGSDDPQAYTESIYQQLARRGVKVGVFGKIMNAWGSDGNYTIPPGITCSRIDNDSFENANSGHWSQQIAVYDGPNAWDGPGVTRTAGQMVNYQYADTIVSASWSGGKARIVTQNAHGFHVGDTAGVQIGTTGYNGYQWTVSDVDSPTVFRYLLPAAQTNQSGGTAYNRQLFSCIRQANEVVTFLGTVSDSDPVFCWVTPHEVHDNQTTYAGTYEKLYGGAVNAADAYSWGGVAGAVSPVNDPADPQYAVVSAQWQARQQMCASVDDMIKTITAYCDGRWGSNWTIVFTSDQGVQQREQKARGDGGSDVSKEYVWDGTMRSPIYIAGPGWQQGVTVSDLHTMHADLCPTFLDLFGFTDHAWHDKRDGISLQRLLTLRANTPNSALLQRALPLKGTFKGNNGVGLVLHDGGKVVRALSGSTCKLYFPMVDYEVAEYTLTTAQNNAYKSAIAAMGTARWNLFAYTNAVRTVRTPPVFVGCKGSAAARGKAVLKP